MGVPYPPEKLESHAYAIFIFIFLTVVVILEASVRLLCSGKMVTRQAYWLMVGFLLLLEAFLVIHSIFILVHISVILIDGLVTLFS